MIGILHGFPGVTPDSLRFPAIVAKLFDQRERKISGLLPEAVNLARKPILLTLIGPMTETEDSQNLCLLNFVEACNGGRNY